MKKRKLKISNTKPRKNLRVYRKNDSDEVDIISLGSDDTETTKEEEEVEGNIRYEVVSATTETKSDSDTDFVEDTPSHMVDKRNRKQKKAREKGRVTSVSFKINLKEGSSKKKKPRKTAKKTKNKEKIWYAQQITRPQKQTPAILHWTSDELKLIETTELAAKKNAEQENAEEQNEEQETAEEQNVEQENAEEPNEEQENAKEQNEEQENAEEQNAENYTYVPPNVDYSDCIHRTGFLYGNWRSISFYLWME
uniref:transcription factor TBF1-like isoform X4 n=1 Tax=Erigeron canadensis TaxID=72917 RepID=UPI001CB94518|nr:transcription factor TBF1-like isoform X4 [Erigeron canadensis]